MVRRVETGVVMGRGKDMTMQKNDGMEAPRPNSHHQRMNLPRY